MKEISKSRSLTIGGTRIQSAKVALDPLTDAITVKLRRPTIGGTVVWDATSQIRVTIGFIVDGVEHKAIGYASGGLLKRADGTEASEYTLTYHPPVFFDSNSNQAKRIGQKASTEVSGYILLEKVKGPTVQTELIIAIATESPPPIWVAHNSVAFDAATDVTEGNGDGIVSLTHTSTGANRAVFACVGAIVTTTTSTSCTYGGAGMTEMWDISTPSVLNAGYQLAGQATGAQTVTSTLAALSGQDHSLGVISMTGVDQTTPVGTPVTASSSSAANASVTVGSVGADDLVVDGLMANWAGGVAPTVGADQTERFYVAGGWVGSHLIGSSQPGTAGGVMSYTHSARSYSIGAVAFKPASVGSTPLTFTGVSNLNG